MFPFRHLPACLCIASLLFSNVAGWLHIGCAESAAGCCGDRPGEVCGDRPGEVIEQQDGHHGCCGHVHHQLNSDWDTGKDAQGSETHPVNEDCPERHDSERCSICQSFFSLRNASGNVGPLPAVSSVTVEVNTFIAVRVGKRTIFLDSISVRGPPRV